MILVSACLLGINCKYNGDNNKDFKVLEYLKDKEFIIVCPEQLGGMSTPRDPSEIIRLDGDAVINGETSVITNKRLDVTKKFKLGANETLKIAKLYNCKEAILKEGSPSCGSNYIYDGTFTGKKRDGIGVTTSLLKHNGIKVISEKEI
ncbi:DUF523 domain-containing protein [Romboutsia lituseburensis]|uniref:Uncharacterized conserved protein YbbK, DUF523 family n=1 Tax=Romboutsia lituseburensis DSM 797 TaxID=1121325 RepID=A0A1G9R3W5_9FIRM|nr:DUF523 domain-containing protein [Romboutsia lituseburensis]CEH35743.1 Purine nucleoside phosphorylase [Romboutsia lituseburensis]SDM17959.1 Uncharacterized conserved protein YbbK, DUF523 family [Romboutsia lituseburensis DSM 797]